MGTWARMVCMLPLMSVPCSGSSAFPLKHVNVGAWRSFTSHGEITNAFKHGTATFNFPASSTDKVVILTLTFLAATSHRGVTYTCPVTISSTKAAVKDKVVAKMVTI